MSRYGLAIVVVVIATLGSIALGPILSRIPFALFFGAIAIVARYAGLGPALVASVLGVLLADRFVFPPRVDAGPISLDEVVVALILGAGTFGGIILFVVAGLMLATSVVGYCPNYTLLGISTRPRLHRVGHHLRGGHA